MKIAYVYDAVHPWETGGVQKRVWELARRLADDHEVYWYGLQYWEGPQVIERDGVILHGVAPAGQLYVDGRRSITEALTFAMQLTRPLLHDDFDVIDCQAFPYFPCFTSKLSAVCNNETLFVTWHEVWGNYWYDYLGRKGMFGKAVEQLSSFVPDVHIAVSEHTKQDIVALGATDVQILPNGIAIDEIAAVPAVNEHVDVLFAGRLISEKNVDLIVRAIDELLTQGFDIQCLLIGEGPERAAIEALIREQGLEKNVRLVPFRESYDEVLGLMKAADVFVLPSQREGFGITVLEALACGTPVVTIAHPQNAAQELVIDGKTGVICDQSYKALAQGIRRAQATVCEADCKNHAAAYNWDTIAERAEEIYQTVV